MRTPKDMSTTGIRTGAAPVRRGERRLGGMTWRDVRAALDGGCDRVVVPFGATEQHGSHLPLETDALLGDCLGPLLADRLDALCGPTLRVGCSEQHMRRAGTLSLHPATLKVIVRDLVDSLARHGFRTIVLLPTHAGNAAPLAHAARVLEPPAGVRLAAIGDMSALAAALQAAAKAGGENVIDAVRHAGEIETALMLALAPQSVRAAGHRQAMAASGRAYVAAFVNECVRQLEVQGVPPCVSA